MQQLDPRAVWFFFIRSVLRWFLFFLIVGGYALAMFWGAQAVEGGFSLVGVGWLVPLFALVLLVLLWAWAKLSYHFYRYELAEYGFKKESGVIYKRYVTIPYDRIQNVDIHRGILARLLGLSDLQIQTAGASATISRYGARGLDAEGRLPGLSREIAEKLRDELVFRTRRPQSQGL